MRILVLGVEPQSLINFRKDLIVELHVRGYSVTVAALESSGEQKSALEGMGADVRVVSFSRAGMNPFRDVVTLASLIGLFRKTRPDVVIAYTAKPVIYGALAARIAGVPRFAAMITGLGYSFITARGVRRRIARGIVPSCTRSR